MTTTQTYQADDDQLAQTNDEAVPADDLMESADDVTGSTTQAEPDADATALDAALPESGPDPMSPDADMTANDEPGSDQAGAVAPAAPEPVIFTASDYPVYTPEADGDAEEPGVADTSADSPSLVSVAFTTPEPVSAALTAADTAAAEGQWNEIRAMFVDDPRASIERAAALVDGRVEELIQSVQARQHSMQSAWQAEDAGTEELRVALQHYRAFWRSLDDLPAQT
jgi:hypothetical protein